MTIQIQRLLADSEPGSNARIEAVIDVFSDWEFLDDAMHSFTFSEVEPVALLVLYQGGRRNLEIAQTIMLIWAENDSDAEVEYVDRLALWGIEPAENHPDLITLKADAQWVITEGAS